MTLFTPLGFACKQDSYGASLSDIESLAKFLSNEDKPRFPNTPPIRGIYMVGLNLIAVEAGDSKQACKVLVFTVTRSPSCERTFAFSTLKKNYECKL